MIRWTVREAAGIITVSQQLKEAVQDLGAPVDDIQVIPNGVDPCRFNPTDRNEARRRLGLPLEAKIVVSVGALVPAKGFQFLIPAIAQIVPRHPHLKLSIVGSGPYRGFIERLVRQYRMEDRVSIMGNRPNEELKYWFSAADLSCLLSSREGQPNVVLESLACGTPVLATRVGGIPEVLTSAELGILVDQEPESIRLGLAQALEKQWDRAAIARQGATRTWDTVGSEVEEFLHTRVSAFQGCRPIGSSGL
jgi:glycosyltransferase involved in cell wall biosynthesis